jgi:hypothetical protein
MNARYVASWIAAALMATQTGCSLFRDKETASTAPETKAVAEAKPKEESFIQQVSHKIMPPSKKEEEKAPTSNSPVKQIHAIWNGQLTTTRDTVNNGAELRGLIGRLYLFGEEVGFPLQAEGTVTVDLYDITPANTQGKPKMLERWEIDKETLKRLGRKDTIGWGYTLFLPWSTYRPDVTRVQMQAKFVPDRGIPLFAPVAQVSVQTDEIIPVSATRPVPPNQRGAKTPDAFIPQVDY